MQRRRWLGLFVAVAGLAAVAGCGGGGGGGDDEPLPAQPTAQVSFGREVQPIFTANCALAGCHVEGGLAPMPLDEATAYANIVNVQGRVSPGNAAGSQLYQLVSTGAMPLNRPALAVADVAKIKNWIDQGARNDLTLALTGMTPHLDQRVEVRVVSKASRQLLAQAIVEPLPAESFTVFLPSSVPPGENVVEFFADLNNSKAYDVPPADHAWRRDIPSTGRVSFAHAPPLDDINTPSVTAGLPFTLNLTGMVPHQGEVFELRVIRVANAQTVGSFRLGAVPASGAFTVAIPGILVAGEQYQVDFFADHNGVPGFQSPPSAAGDHAWRLTGTAGAAGLTLDFVHNITFTDIGFLTALAARTAAVGTITGFGSVFVNGTEFEVTSATRIAVDDNPSATEDHLRVGMVVNVSGVVDDQGRGVATEIEFENSLEGPIDAADLAAGTVTVMGRTVKLNDLTVFDGLTTAQLTPGTMVEVSGLDQGGGSVLARRIELKVAGDDEVEVKGAVAGLDATARTFTLSGFTVDYAAAAIDAAITAAGGLADGMFVEVKSDAAPAAGTIQATAVQLEDDGVSGEDVEVRIEGLVTAFTSAADFQVAGHRVTTNAQTLFKRGVAGDVAPGRSVEVEGALDGSGVLVAKEVSFELARNVKIEADAGSVETTSGIVTVLGIAVAVDANTLLRDKSQLDDANFQVADLEPGQRVRVRAFVDPATGAVIATKVERDDAKDRVIVQGPASAVGATTVTILGVQFELSTVQANQFRDAAGNQVTFEAFLGLANRGVAGQGNNLVKLRGTVTGGVVTWERAEIELEHEFENEVENEFEQEIEIENEIEVETPG